MRNRWKSLSYTTRFSIVAGVGLFALGFLSMGLTGAVLYYTVFMVLGSFPPMDDWHGDWVWPAMILVSILFPLGFIFGGLAWHYLKAKISSKIVLRIIYILILWLWTAFLWYFTLRINGDNMN